MIKKTIIILSFIITAILLIGCNIGVANVKDTDLRNVFIDNLSIGTSIKKINLNRYTESDRYLGNYMCKFDELIIDSKDNKINYLFGRFDEKKTIISVNGKTGLTNINEVSKILGNNFKEKWKDREQGLKKHIYFDNINNIKAEFIYSTFDNNLVWIMIFQMNN